MLICYYSSKSRNTAKFVEKLNLRSIEIDEGLIVREPFILFSGTYARSDGLKAVHKSVIDFLKNNKEFIRGVVGSGNINFGQNFAISADVISEKCNVPIFHKYELRGTEKDVKIIREKIEYARNRL